MSRNNTSLPVPGLGPLESAIMLAVWEAPGPVSVREVLQQLEHDRPLAYTTVMTVMDILHRKEILMRSKDGRAWRYAPVMSLRDYLTQRLDDLTRQMWMLISQVSVRQDTLKYPNGDFQLHEPTMIQYASDFQNHRYSVDRGLPLTEVDVAQKITVALEDDLDGGPADETLRFSFGGAEYEIDLSTHNADSFRKQLAPYVEHARKAGKPQARRTARTATNRQHSGDIRAWAKSQGIAVSERGRIPASVVEQYQAAKK